MDIRTAIIQAVMEALQGRVSDEAASIVQDTLTIQLNNYEFNPKVEAYEPPGAARWPICFYFAPKGGIYMGIRARP